MADDDGMDESAVRAALGHALSLQARSLVEMTAPGDLLEHEREVVAALHAVIEHSGQEPRSEALEHLLEHVIMRKQQQVDFLGLAIDA